MVEMSAEGHAIIFQFMMQSKNFVSLFKKKVLKNKRKIGEVCNYINM